MARQELVEYHTPSIANLVILNEEEGDLKKNLFLSGIAIQGDIQNKNGRIYPKSEIERAVEDMKQRIGEFGPILGECDHPDNLNVSLDRSSHLIKDAWMEGSDGHAKFDVVPVGLGELIIGFVRHGAKIGVSSRGSGSVDSRGYVSEFEIVTIDIVANPSAPNAYPKPVFESLMTTKRGRELASLHEALRHDETAQKYFNDTIKQFLYTELAPRKK